MRGFAFHKRKDKSTHVHSEEYDYSCYGKDSFQILHIVFPYLYQTRSQYAAVKNYIAAKRYFQALFYDIIVQYLNRNSVDQPEEDMAENNELKIDKHTLLGKWRARAYDEKANKGDLQRLWSAYFDTEKGIYEELLADPDTEVKGTVKELAEKFGVDILTMTGFLDGINDSLKEPNPIETMKESTVVSLAFDKELLYKNMVKAEADWLYNIPAWNDIFDEDKKKALYLEQKRSGTVIKGKKIGRNDPCPCGSGKKYKYCCGRN